jgi:peptide chain release factor 1
MSFLTDEQLQNVLARGDELRRELSEFDGSDPTRFTQLSRELSELTPVLESAETFLKKRQELLETEQMMQDQELDQEFRQMAESDHYALKEALPALERQLMLALLPKDSDDDKNAILEIRAGAGGDEASLFAAEMFRAYERYAAVQGWRFEIMSISENGIDGYKECSANITGKSVFARLKFEAGVHRVQRVPTTESSGRIHTSTITVAIMPEAEEVDVQIDEKDLRVDIFRASGPGGQGVNTTDSAVRITHIPTGIVVSQQDERSQIKNRAKGMKVLRARLYELKRQEKDAARAANRKSQVGTGDRSERIRTYNFPQGRVSDHRINLTLYKIDKVMLGELDEFIDALIAEDQTERLAELS